MSVPAFLFGGVLVIVGLIVSMIVHPAALLVSFVGLIVPLFVEIPRRYTWYLLTTEEVYKKTGVLREDVISTRYDNIEKAQKDADIIERIFGFADVMLYTAATGMVEFVLDDVPNPNTFIRNVTNQVDISRERGYTRSRQDVEDEMNSP